MAGFTRYHVLAPNSPRPVDGSCVSVCNGKAGVTEEQIIKALGNSFTPYVGKVERHIYMPPLVRIPKVAKPKKKPEPPVMSTEFISSP
jgi:hypothetical protein